MNLKAAVTALGMAAVIGTSVLPAIPAAAQGSRHRQNTKNTWRNVAIGSGALGVYGLLSHNSTAAILGGAGALYSLNRYEHDRKSQSAEQRREAAYYGRSSFVRNGHHYHRRVVTRHGHKYYQFVRG
jgi:hypothetical protein